MPELSVILCTHNPRPDYLSVTLEGLARQTLAREQWELVLVDNASAPPIDSTLATKAHPLARTVREEQPGLTLARLRGMAETTAPVLVFVDDDNVLDADYLEHVLALATKWTELGAWGGQTIARYEEPPAEWLKPWCWVAVRELERDEWCNNSIDGRAVPFGAGLCVRRAVAERYQEKLANDPLRRQLDRVGNSGLGGAGDVDLVYTANELGLGRGLFRSLKLQHLIPRERTQPGYLLSLVNATVCSTQVLLHLHGQPTVKEPHWPWWRRWWRLRHVTQREQPFILAVHEGQRRSTAIIATLKNGQDFSKTLRTFEQTPLRWSGEARRENYSETRERPAQPLPSLHAEERRTAAAELTRLMNATPGFTYLRLGDGELRSLLAAQNHTWKDANIVPQLSASVEIANSNPGLREVDMPRLLRAYEVCSWLDRYESQPYNREHLHELQLERTLEATENRSPHLSKLFIDWTWHEMRSYLEKHRCLFCGAEAAHVQALLAEPEYRKLAARFWPEKGDRFFLQPRRDGKFLSEDLDAIRDDLIESIHRHRVDTLFLALGGGAKILAHELSRETGVRVFDFGSMLRALTFSGSDGQSTWRSAHYPFLLRVPFALYMRTLVAAHPDLDSVTLAAKAHAQLVRELIRQVPLEFTACELDDPAAYDASRDNVRHFLESYAVYRRHYYPWIKKHPETAPLLKEFHRWRMNQGLGLDGKLYQLARTLYQQMKPTSRP